jgi:hypothetical protein
MGEGEGGEFVFVYVEEAQMIRWRECFLPQRICWRKMYLATACPVKRGIHTKKHEKFAFGK